jgi:sensor histidine kinase YesM
VPENLKELTVPVLSLLPLLENITVHNRIDSDHPMQVTITSRDKAIMVCNTLQPKKSTPSTNGTGLDNLSHRYQVLKGMDISIEKDEKTFCVILPL